MTLPNLSAHSLVVDRGWWQADLGGVLVTYMDQRMADDAYGRYLSNLASEIDGAAESNRRCVLNEVPDAGSTTAARRKAAADILHARREKLSRITIAYALVTPSALARGALTAVFWLAPPPYPWRVPRDVGEAFRWFATFDGRLDAPTMLSRYDGLKRRLAESTGQQESGRIRA
jgi:hypothetical protein